MRSRSVLLGLVMAIAFLAGLAGLALAGAVQRSAAERVPQGGAPQLVSFQGQVALDGTPFQGIGHFKFAVVDASGSTSYWSNDHSSVGGSEPTLGVPLLVTGGLFDVLLGDTNLTGMTTPLDATAFQSGETYLRVWFSPDDIGYQLLNPDRRISAVPYALKAEEAAHATDADTLGGQHADDLGLPAGTLVLGASADEGVLTSAGLSYTGRWFDTWNSRTELPTRRYLHGAAAVDGEIYVIGGFSSTTLGSNEAYDPASDTWRNRAPMPTARTGMSIVALDGVIYAIGGLSGSDYLPTVEAYYPISNTWISLAPMPTARYAAAVAAVDGVVYVIGGSSATENYLDTVEAYFPETDSWEARMPLPVGRSYAAAAAVDGIIYVIGGRSVGMDYETANEAFNPVTNLWTARADMMIGRRASAVVALDGLVYVIGGYTSQNDYTLNTAFDPAGNAWHTRSDLPTGRFYLAAAGVDGQIYALGGTGANDSVGFANEVYGPPLYVYRQD